MRLAAEGAQHINRIAVTLGQCLAVTDTHHLRAAAFIFSLLPSDVARVLRMRRIGDVEDRSAVRFGLPGDWIEGSGNGIGAAVVSDIGDPAVALMMDGRLIGAARLQIIAADQPHVEGFGRSSDYLLLRFSAGTAGEEKDRGGRDQQSPMTHVVTQLASGAVGGRLIVLRHIIAKLAWIALRLRSS